MVMKLEVTEVTSEKAKAALQYANALLDSGEPVEHVIADVRRVFRLIIDASELTIPAPRAVGRGKPARWNPWQGTPSPK